MVFGMLKYRLYRIKRVRDIPDAWFSEKKILKGQVTRVGDGDGFRLLHEPPWSYYFGVWGTVERKDTLSIRLAGIDAPELGHFGKTPQPFAQEAKDWLSDYVLHQTVQVKLLQRDQYERAVGMVLVRKRFLWIFPVWKNVSLEMVRLGLACVYEGAMGSYDDLRDSLVKAEQVAKRNRRGMWAAKGETPMEYKKRHRA